MGVRDRNAKDKTNFLCTMKIVTNRARSGDGEENAWSNLLTILDKNGFGGIGRCFS